MSCFMPINDTYLYFLFSATNLQGKAYLPEMLKTGFDLWVGKIPWRRELLLTPVFWPGEFHGLYSVWGCKELDMTEQFSLSAFFMVQCSYPYTTTGKTISLTIRTFVGKVMSLLFNMLSKKKEKIGANWCTSAGRWQPSRIMESV